MASLAYRKSDLGGADMRQVLEKRKGRLLGIAVLGLVALAVAAPMAFGANTNPSLAFTPSMVHFERDPRSGNTDAVFVLANSGKGATGALTINLVNVSGSAFSVVADGCTGKKLTANKSCSVTVRYTRANATTFDSGQLLAISNKPLTNATANFTDELSEGCAAVNSANFQGQYPDAGVDLHFNGGETVTVTAADPNDLGTPTRVILFSGDANHVVDDVPYPGTAHFVIPPNGSDLIGWRTDGLTGLGPTWAVTCG